MISSKAKLAVASAAAPPPREAPPAWQAAIEASQKNDEDRVLTESARKKQRQYDLLRAADGARKQQIKSAHQQIGRAHV